MITGDIPQPKIILEGTHLTRKTEIAFALAEHVDIIGVRKQRWHIPLISSEWETRSDKQPTKSDQGRSMIDFLDGDEAWMYECFENYVRLFELHRDYYWIVDRFHISTISFQRHMRGKVIELDWVDRRLDQLGFVMIHLYRQPDTFAAAREHRLTYSENPTRYDDLDVFIKEQEIMAELIKNSPLRSKSIDVSEGNIDQIAQDIINWVKSIGAFWRPTDTCFQRKTNDSHNDSATVLDCNTSDAHA